MAAGPGTASDGAQALAAAAGLLVRTDRATWHATGADRVGYLHRMLTQDVRGLGAGRGTYACVLTPEGRVLSDLLLWAEPGHVVLDLPRRGAERALPHLERYVIADDVAFADVSPGTARFLLAGPAAPAVLARAGAPPPAPRALGALPAGGPAARVLRWDLGSRPAFEGFVPADAAAAVLGVLRGDPAVAPISDDDLLAACVEEGVATFGREIDDRILPNEARLEDAISFTKGCYPGQEPVVMARHRGHPPTLLVRLALEGIDLPAAGATLLREGRAVGRVTSVAPGGLALGFVRHALAAAGTPLDVEGGARATILP